MSTRSNSRSSKASPSKKSGRTSRAAVKKGNTVRAKTGRQTKATPKKVGKRATKAVLSKPEKRSKGSSLARKPQKAVKKLSTKKTLVTKVAKTPAIKEKTVRLTKTDAILPVSSNAKPQPKSPAKPASTAAVSPPPSRTVLRIAGGRGKPVTREPAPKPGPAEPKQVSHVHLVPTQSAAAGSTAAKKPMSVAEKKRAEAEAAFRSVQGVSVRPSTPTEAPPSQHGGSDYLKRISERDALTTQLRAANAKDGILQAAQALAERFQLPPDQGLLVKVIDTGEPKLTKLALEELIELDDRGRVRKTHDLESSLLRIRPADTETAELKALLLQKIGA